MSRRKKVKLHDDGKESDNQDTQDGSETTAGIVERRSSSILLFRLDNTIHRTLECQTLRVIHNISTWTRLELIWSHVTET